MIAWVKRRASCSAIDSGNAASLPILPWSAGRVRLNGLPFTITGVAAQEFAGLLFSGLSADVWVPMSALTRFRGDVRADRAERWLFVKGRLRDGVAVAQVTAALDVLGTQLRAAHPDSNADRTFRAIPATDVIINPEADPGGAPLAAAVVALGMLVLVIASANVASVLMARMAQRGRELAVRASIGATRRQLAGLLAAEAVVTRYRRARLRRRSCRTAALRLLQPGGRRCRFRSAGASSSTSE